MATPPGQVSWVGLAEVPGGTTQGRHTAVTQPAPPVSGEDMEGWRTGPPCSGHSHLQRKQHQHRIVIQHLPPLYIHSSRSSRTPTPLPAVRAAHAPLPMAREPTPLTPAGGACRMCPFNGEGARAWRALATSHQAVERGRNPSLRDMVLPVIRTGNRGRATRGWWWGDAGLGTDVPDSWAQTGRTSCLYFPRLGTVGM